MHVLKRENFKSLSRRDIMVPRTARYSSTLKNINDELNLVPVAEIV